MKKEIKLKVVRNGKELTLYYQTHDKWKAEAKLDQFADDKKVTYARIDI